MPSAADVSILTSGMGLGHYVPALLLRDALRQLGRHAEVHVFESFLGSETQSRIARTTAAYQSNFGKALVGQRLHGVLGTAQMPELRELRMADRIVVFAGCWCPHLRTVRASSIELVHVDVSSSPSWVAAADAVRSLKESGARELWFSRKDPSGRRLAISDTCAAPIPWSDREKRVLVHGGGWAIGDFDAAIGRLRKMSIDVLLGSRPRLLTVPSGVRQFGWPPDWQPWSAPADLPFPPLIAKSIDGDRPLGSGARHHVLDLIAGCKAVVSKPGGMALAESLMTATPLVFLAPFGQHELTNARNWINDGLGIWLDDWQASGFAEEALEIVHANLIAAREKISRYECD